MGRFTLKGYGNGTQTGGVGPVYTGYDPNQEGGRRGGKRRRRVMFGGARTRKQAALEADEALSLMNVSTRSGSSSGASASSSDKTYAFQKGKPNRKRDRSKQTDLDLFLQMMGLIRKGDKKTHWHKAIVPFKLHGANAGKMFRTVRAAWLLKALFDAFSNRQRRGTRAYRELIETVKTQGKGNMRGILDLAALGKAARFQKRYKGKKTGAQKADLFIKRYNIPRNLIDVDADGNVELASVVAHQRGDGLRQKGGIFPALIPLAILGGKAVASGALAAGAGFGVTKGLQAAFR